MALHLRESLYRLWARARLWMRDVTPTEKSESSRTLHNTIPIARAQCRKRATMVGRVQSVSFRPATQSVSMSAIITDGSASLTLLWLGRAEVPGIVPGAELKVEGMVANVEDVATIINPRYDLLTPGDHTYGE